MKENDMAKATPAGNPEPYQVRLRGSSEARTIEAGSQEEAVAKFKAETKTKRADVNIEAVPVRLLPKPGQPAVRPPRNDVPTS